MIRGLLLAALLMAPATQAVSQPSASEATLDHVAIQVVDLDKSVAFYQSVFGFQQIPAPFPIARWLDMRNGRSLHIVSGRTTPRTVERWEHFAVSCPDMAAMVARLDKLGVAWSDIQGRRQVQLRPDGVEQIFVQDPDGYWIEINARTMGAAKP